MARFILKRKEDMKEQGYNVQLDEQGSVLVVALIMLVLLTLIGVFAATTTQIETQIAGNERIYAENFYVSDSAWKESIAWLNNLPNVPSPINFANPLVVPSGTTDIETITDNNLLNVRNYGNVSGIDFDPTDDPPAASPDGAMGQAKRPIPYWHKAAFYLGPGDTVNGVMTGYTRSGLGANERVFDFIITGNANETQEVQVTVSRVLTSGSPSGY